jgi:hypothetical protein
MRTPRKMPSLLIAICTLGFTLAACNPESPSETRADVADARAEGRENVAEARRDASENLIDARQNMDEASAQYRSESAQSERDIALAQAEASHRISTEKCDAMTADQQDACNDAADRDLERATTLSAGDASASPAPRVR